MMDLITMNLMKVFLGVGCFVIAWLSNFCVSMYYNIGANQEAFDKKKLFKGILKLIAIALGTALLTIGITTFIEYLEYAGLVVPESLDGVNIITIVGIYAGATGYYLKDCFMTLKGIFGEEEVVSGEVST